MPITWKNIAGADLEGGALIGASVNDSLQSLQGFLNDAEAGHKARSQAVSGDERETNTDYFNDRLAEMSSVSELEANKGNIDALVQQFDGQNIDQDMIRGAYSEKLTGLRTAESEENKYKLDVAIEKASPYAQKFKSLMTKGGKENVAAANAILEKHGDLFSAARMTSDLATWANDAQQRRIVEGRETERYNLEKQERKDQRTYMGLIDTAIDNVGTRAENRTELSNLVSLNGLDHLADEIYQKFDSIWNQRKGLTPNDEFEIEEEIKEATRNRDVTLAGYDAADANVLVDHPVNQRYAFTDKEKPSAQTAHDYLAKQGIDQEGQYEILEDKVDWALAEYYKPKDGGEIVYPPEFNSDMRQAMINELAATVTGDRWWGDTDINESKEKLNARAKYIISEWEKSIQNKPIQRGVRKASALGRAAAEQTFQESNLASYRVRRIKNGALKP